MVGSLCPAAWLIVTLGEVVSMVTTSAPEADDVFPAASVALAVIEWAPVLNAEDSERKRVALRRNHHVRVDDAILFSARYYFASQQNQRPGGIVHQNQFVYARAIVNLPPLLPRL